MADMDVDQLFPQQNSNRQKAALQAINNRFNRAYRSLVRYT